jgi:hypothetical protein
MGKTIFIIGAMKDGVTKPMTVALTKEVLSDVS